MIVFIEPLRLSGFAVLFLTDLPEFLFVKLSQIIGSIKSLAT